MRLEINFTFCNYKKQKANRNSLFVNNFVIILLLSIVCYLGHCVKNILNKKNNDMRSGEPTLVGAFSPIFVKGPLGEFLKSKKKTLHNITGLGLQNTYYISKIKMLLSLLTKIVYLRESLKLGGPLVLRAFARHWICRKILTTQNLLLTCFWLV